jgi:hypothetical protein
MLLTKFLRSRSVAGTFVVLLSPQVSFGAWKCVESLNSFLSPPFTVLGTRPQATYDEKFIRELFSPKRVVLQELDWVKSTPESLVPPYSFRTQWLSPLKDAPVPREMGDVLNSLITKQQSAEWVQILDSSGEVLNQTLVRGRLGGDSVLEWTYETGLRGPLYQWIYRNTVSQRERAKSVRYLRISAWAEMAVLDAGTGQQVEKIIYPLTRSELNAAKSLSQLGLDVDIQFTAVTGSRSTYTAVFRGGEDVTSRRAINFTQSQGN